MSVQVLSLWHGQMLVSTRPESMADIARRVADSHRLSVADIRGPCRERSYAVARQEFCFEARKQLRWSFPQIGRFLNRDHSTVIHAVTAHQDRMNGKPDLRGRRKRASPITCEAAVTM